MKCFHHIKNALALMKCFHYNKLLGNDLTILLYEDIKSFCRGRGSNLGLEGIITKNIFDNLPETLK